MATISCPSSSLADRRNTYESKFFKEIGYCSDSRGGWHHGSPLDHAALGEGRALQLLTHAIWWTGEDPPRAGGGDSTTDADREEGGGCAAAGAGAPLGVALTFALSGLVTFTIWSLNSDPLRIGSTLVCIYT